MAEEDLSQKLGKAEGEAETPKKSKKKLIIIFVAVLLLAGGGAFFMLGDKGEKIEETSLEETQETKEKVYYYKMDEFLVNLNAPGSRTSLVRTNISLVLDSEEAKSEVEEKMPLIRDSFLIYLRELRPSDLRGSSGIFNLKDELLLRINSIIEPNEVQDILFEEIVVQGQ